MARQISALEGEYRLVRIVNIRRLFFIIMVATMAVLIGLLMSVAGASLKPLFLPVDSFLYTLLAVGLAFVLVTFWFRILEIKFNPSSSRKFLMAKNSQKKAMVTLVATAMIAVVLLLPFTATAAATALKPETIKLDTLNNSFNFFSRDNFGLTTIKNVQVENLDPTSSIDVYIFHKEDYEDFLVGASANVASAVNPWNHEIADTEDITFEKTDFEEFVVYLDSNNNPDAEAMITFEVEISRNFTLLTPILLFLYTAANGAWIAYLQPVRKKYEGTSIYR